MSVFLYFLETTPARPALPTAAQIRDAGLGHILDGEGVTANQTTRGPGEKAGFMVCSLPSGKSMQPKYKPDEQTWEQGPDGAYWIGHYHNEPLPAPVDLVRKRPINGHALRLLDENEWTIPVARSIANGATLPTRLVLGPDKKAWLSRTLPQYLHLCELADDAFWLFNSSAENPHPQAKYGEASGMSYPFDYGMHLAMAAMGVNYKIGPMEASMLGILGDEQLQTIMEAVIDWPAFVEMAKAAAKKASAPDSSSTDNGSGASSPDTSPPSAT